MSEETGDWVLGASFAALDRDAAAEGPSPCVFSPRGC